MQTLTELVDSHMINLLYEMAKIYNSKPKVLVGLFQNDKSIKMAFAFIKSAVERSGALEQAKRETGKDFTAWCQKQTEEKWVPVLNSVLIMIYALNNK